MLSAIQCNQGVAIDVFCPYCSLFLSPSYVWVKQFSLGSIKSKFGSKEKGDF